jgi:DNA-binding response OmpR family regulator
LDAIPNKVLLIDDSPLFLEALEPQLKKRDWDVHTESSGAAGIACLRTVRPEVVITDLHMPDLSGIHVIRAVRRVDPHLPVLVLSGDEEVESILSVIHEGAFDYVVKPYEEIRPLLASLERARSHYRLVSENRRLNLEVREMQDRLAQSVHSELSATKALHRRIRHGLSKVLVGISELSAAGLSEDLNRSVVTMGTALGSVLELVESDRTDSVSIEGGQDFSVYEIVAAVRDQVVGSLHDQDLEFAYLLPGTLPPLVGPAEELRELLRRMVASVVEAAEPGDVELRATVSSRTEALATLVFEIRAPPRKRSRAENRLAKASFEWAMCVRLVEGLGGEIGESREEGQSQRVWFSVRLGHLDEDGTASPLTGMSALVVDASGAARRCMAMEFDALGARCVAVSSCAAGLQTLQRLTTTSTFDVVMVSLGEAGSQGARLLEFVDRLEPRPLVITTGRTNEPEGSTDGRVHFIKPVRRRDLVSVLQAEGSD